MRMWNDKLEEYSKGVQSRIAKLTRKMREAERQRDAATEYARAIEERIISLINTILEGVPKNFFTKMDHPLKDGFISLQSEGHPVQFRKIKIKELD